MFCSHDGSLGRHPKPKIEDYLPRLNTDRPKLEGAEYIDGVMIIRGCDK